MNFLQGQRVLVLGLGASGLAMASWCVRCGAEVSCWDSRELPPGAEALAQSLPQVRRLASLPLTLSGQSAGEGRSPWLVLKSPGLSPRDPLVAPLLRDARDAGIAVLGELDLFVRALADLREQRAYAPKLLAVTGTNGKTTTTALTTLLVARAGRRVVMAGNIGPTLLDTLAAQLQRPVGDWPEVWVLELSSFQLAGGGDGVREFEPTAAALLNISQDHLDWHGDMAAYVAAKARVFGSQAVMVLNRDDPQVLALQPAPPAVKGKPKAVPRSVLLFGLDMPHRAGDFGLLVEGGMAWLVRALPAEDSSPRRRKAADDEIHLQRLMPADALRLRGRHNAANALAALALATAIDMPLAPMLHGLREYAGEPHRLQFVAAIDGVEAFDDSKGTNVGATVAALLGLGADKAPGKLVLILGGDGKGQDFAPLAAPLARHARAVATIGRDAAAIEGAIADALQGLPLQRHESLEQAVGWCFAQARPGDAVLLSPACASLDMFRNYGHRAEVFVSAVQALAAQRGQPS